MQGEGSYKFLDSADVSKVITDGTIVISSFDYFRKLEEKEWGLIADPLEGASELTTEPMVVRENSTELEMLNNANIGLGMFKKFAHVSGGGIISMGAVKFVHAIPGYIYCASVGKLEDLIAYMTKKAERKIRCMFKNKRFAKLRSATFQQRLDSRRGKAVPRFIQPRRDR
jgi:hypothetical protein